MRITILTLCLLICICSACDGTGVEPEETTAPTAQVRREDAEAPEDTETPVEGTSLEETQNLLGAALLDGSVEYASETGCTVYMTITEDQGDGTELSFQGDLVPVIYADGVEFMTAVIQADGSGYTLDSATRADVVEGSFLYIYGWENEEGYQATTVLIAEFIY